MLSPGVTYNIGIFRLVKLNKTNISVKFTMECCFKMGICSDSCCLPSSSSVPGMVGQGPPFTGQPAISSVTGVKINQPNISTVTTATQPIMPQQQVAPNQQQPVPPQGQPVPNQQPQAPPQQQPTLNQPTAPSAQPNMVSYDNQDKVNNTHMWDFCFTML